MQSDNALDTSPPDYRERRHVVFLVLAGIFLGTLAMLNILGISRFLDLSITIFGFELPLPVALGVLPYPITFLCTDLLSELYGKRKTNQVVWMGLALNLWVMLIMWIGGILPGMEPLDPQTGLPALDAAGRPPVFFEIRALAFGAVSASMVAYLTAQFCDVHLFHFFKRLTGGRHLWLRNNGSTLISQLVDTSAVILITHFYAAALPIDAAQPVWPQLLEFITAGYIFKLLVAIVDTLPFYLLVKWLSGYLGLSEGEEVE